MASTALSEPKARPDRAPSLSLAADSPHSASPFPSPSSSFLPPPMPGAHEFAVKPAPPGRMGKKVAQKTDQDTSPPDTSSPSPNPPSPKQSRDPSPQPALSPTTPTPNKFFRQPSPSPHLSKSSPSPTTSAATTPTTSTTSLPKSQTLPKTPTSPSSPSFYTALRSASSLASARDSASLTSNRPAPPSPAMSRRASAAPSVSSTRSKSSRSPSTTISRANSTRKTASATPSRQSTQLTPSSLPSGSSLTTPPTLASTTPKRRSLVKIRDFAFPNTDDRHNGLGLDIPRPNRIKTLNRHLRSGSLSSASSSTSSDDEGDDDDDDGDGWGGFKWGMGRFSWQFGAAAGGSSGVGDTAGTSGEGGFPSNTDFARNFVDGADDPDEGGDEDGSDEFDDEDGELEDIGDEEPLYPGLYRALYSFEPEGTAEMALEEDQIVKVIGRGGGVGWAVVIDDEKAKAGGVGGAHALVPESYLEVVRLDEEDEEGNE